MIFCSFLSSFLLERSVRIVVVSLQPICKYNSLSRTTISTCRCYPYGKIPYINLAELYSGLISTGHVDCLMLSGKQQSKYCSHNRNGKSSFYTFSARSGYLLVMPASWSYRPRTRSTTPSTDPIMIERNHQQSR